VRGAEACGAGQPGGAGHAPGVRPTRRGSPRGRCRARGGPPRREPRAAGRHTGVVMGGGDEPCARVGGAPGSRWAGGACAAGGGRCRQAGPRPLPCRPRGPGAVASAVLGAWAAGGGSDTRAGRGRRGAGRRLAGAGAPEVVLGASGARGAGAALACARLDAAPARRGGAALRSGASVWGGQDRRALPGDGAAARGVGDLRAGRRRRTDAQHGSARAPSRRAVAHGQLWNSACRGLALCRTHDDGGGDVAATAAHGLGVPHCGRVYS
jgi:hypothetical protein